MSQAMARLRAEKINIHMINSFALRRVRAGGRRRGDRAAPGAARAPVDLVEITETIPARMIGDRRHPAQVIEITEPGKRTARRRVPSILRMGERDRRRRAAEAYAYAVERIGSMGGASAEGDIVDGGVESNDGGITARLKHAAVIRTVEAALDAHGALLVPKPCGPKGRRAITARGLLYAICIDGTEVRTVLHLAGWSGQSRDARALKQSAEGLLEVMADALGIDD